MTTKIRPSAWLSITQDMLNRQHLTLNELDALILIVRAAENEKVMLIKTRRASQFGPLGPSPLEELSNALDTFKSMINRLNSSANPAPYTPCKGCWFHKPDPILQVLPTVNEEQNS